MKKICLILAVFSTLFAHSQKFQFGAKAGANFSNFLGGNFDNVDKKTNVGFHGGLFLRFKLSKFAIQPEAMISTQGARIDSVSGNYNWKITYINVPVMLQFFTAAGIYFEAGPQVGFRISDDIENETLKNFANDLDLSIAAGLGIRGKKGLGIGARYFVGLSKIGEFEPPNGIDPDFKNGVAQLSLYIPLTR